MPMVDVTQIILTEEMGELKELKKNEDVKLACEQFQAECKLRGELTKARKEKTVTQSQLQELTGLNQQTISGIEVNFDVSPSLKNLIKYVNALGYELTLTPKHSE